MTENSSQNINITSKSRNPFVGIRPLKVTEKHLFFGRDKHVNLVVEKLLANRFVVISGGSGIGKSSLVNCGIIPRVEAEGSWKKIYSEITDSPIENLYNDVLSVSGKTPGKENAFNEKSFKRSELITLLKEDYKESKSRYLFFIDQLDQLVLNRVSKNKEAFEKMISTYISLLVDLLKEAEIPVYIIMTVRSDYMGEFSNFAEFAELINSSNYLLPQMSDDDLYEAIKGPLEYAGVDWDSKLPDRIINDLSGKPDKLPLMQHALLRTFNAWKESGPPGGPMTVKLYEEIGTAANALEKHAEEAYNELDRKNKQVCERIFKNITAKTPDNRFVKLHTKIGELAQIAQVDDYQVIKIINVFNRKSRAFLNPPEDTLLTEDTYISLSHEALIRNWDRLKKWVNEEAESIKIYKKLAESAFQFQLGKAELWSPPELDQAIEWRDKNSPNVTWARRHNPAFERTMVFLNLSENEYHQEKENKERTERLRKKWTRIMAIAGAAAALIILLVVIFSGEADQSEQQAGMQPRMNNETIADRGQEEDAEIQEEMPGNQEDVDQESIQESANDNFAQQEPQSFQEQDEPEQVQQQERTTTTDLQERAETPVRVQEETGTDISATEDEDQQTQNREDPPVNQQADTETEEPEEEVVIPEPEPRQETVETPSRATLSKERMVNVSESMAEASLQTDEDQDLKSLLAYQSFLFNQEYNNNSFKPVIYDALYKSMQSQLGNSFNAYKGHSNAVRTIEFMPNSSRFFSAGNDGSVLRWDAASEKPQSTTLITGRGIIEEMSITRNGKWLIISETRNGLLLMNLNSGGSNPDIIKGEDLYVHSIAVAPDNNTFYTAGTSNHIEKCNITSRSAEVIIQTDSRINSLDLSKDGQTLAAGTRSGKVITWNTSGSYVANVIFEDAGNVVQSVSFSPDGRYLACGTQRGKILVFRTSDFELIREMPGHTARVTEIDFSPNGQFMASSAYDGKVLLWNMRDLSSSPVIFNDNGGFVFSVNFSKNGNHVVSGSAQENRLVVRPVSQASLAQRVCFLVSRNLTRQEWRNYVGNDIPWRETCTDK